MIPNKYVKVVMIIYKARWQRLTKASTELRSPKSIWAILRM